MHFISYNINEVNKKLKTVVYADVLFIINFIINMIILKITSVFSQIKPGVSRLVLASSIGAVYALFMFFPQIKLLYIFPVKLLVSLIMIKITVRDSKVLRLIKLTAMFYLVSFAFAGILLALIYFTDFAKGSAPVISNGIFYYDISLKNLLITSVIAYILIKIASAIISRNKILGIKSIKIFLGSNECILNALSDTGNLLKEPLSDRPVIIAEKESIENLFPDGVPDCKNPGTSYTNMRIIPYSSIGTSSGIMTGFVPDRITVDGNCVCDVVIGISETPLSQGNEYNALFNPNIIKTGRS